MSLPPLLFLTTLWPLLGRLRVGLALLLALLMLDRRGSLVGRGWGGCPPNALAAGLRRLGVRDRGSALLRRRRRAGTLIDLLLALRRLRLCALLLSVLSHQGVLRLIAVLVFVQHLLLLDPGISIS